MRAPARRAGQDRGGQRAAGGAQRAARRAEGHRRRADAGVRGAARRDHFR